MIEIKKGITLWYLFFVLMVIYSYITYINKQTMIYKLVTKNREYYGERTGETNKDAIRIPENIRKFRFWLWYKNPNVKVYRYNNYKWELVFNFPYRKLWR